MSQNTGSSPKTLATGGLSDAAALVAQRTGGTSLLSATGRSRILTRLDPTLVDLAAASIDARLNGSPA